MAHKKQDIITFKVDDSLSELMRDIPNRSEFIRSAILAAMENTCPLCLGTGILTPHQRKHWETFAVNHPMRHCDDCDSAYLECAKDEA